MDAIYYILLSFIKTRREVALDSDGSTDKYFATYSLWLIFGPVFSVIVALLYNLIDFFKNIGEGVLFVISVALYLVIISARYLSEKRKLKVLESYKNCSFCNSAKAIYFVLIFFIGSLVSIIVYYFLFMNY